MLLLFEDAHWSDPSSVELLDAVIEQVPDLPVLLVISFRPEFVAPWFGRPGVSLMALSRLDRRDATALAAQVVKIHVLSSPLLDRIVVQSDGVPLFIEELTKAVLEAPELGTPGATLAVPDTLQASLMARLDRLPAAKQLHRSALLLDGSFHTCFLPRRPRDSRMRSLQRGLTAVGALRGCCFKRGVPPDAVYQFKHALVRDVAYASLPKALAPDSCIGISAKPCRDRLPEQAEAEPEVVAYHLRRPV